MIAGYEILHQIACGGVATVYKARQSALGRSVALKVFDGEAQETEALERFILEAHILGELAHPGIVRIFELGLGIGKPFMAIEYVDTGSLADRIMSKRLTEKSALRTIRKLAFSLSHLHQRGIVHRDVKPDNVLLRERDPVLADFGIAVRVESSFDEAPAGSPHYMSPEQARGGMLDGRADLYSLGITLYELLTGRRPFRAGTATELANKHLYSPLPELPKRLAHIQPVLDRLLAKNPADRFPNAPAVIRAIQRLDHMRRNKAHIVALRPANLRQQAILSLDDHPSKAIG